MDGKLHYEITADGDRFTRVVDVALSSVGRLGVGLTALASLVGGNALSRGFGFAQELADSEKAIANVIARFQGLNQAASENVAADVIAEIKRLEPETAAGLRDMVQGFMATAAAAQGAGISVRENVDLVAKFANALANASIPAEQLAQELRSIMTGNIGADSALARTLGITNEDVNKARNQGKLYEYLTGTLGTLGTAGETAAVAFSTLESAVDKALAELGKPVLEQTVLVAKALTEAVSDPQLATSLKEVGRNIAELIALASNAGPALSGLVSGLNVFGRFSRDAVKASGDMIAATSKWIVENRKVVMAINPVGYALFEATRRTVQYAEASNAAAAKNETISRSFREMKEAMAAVRQVDWATLKSQGEATQAQWLKEAREEAIKLSVELEKAKDAQAESGGDSEMIKRLDEKIQVYRDLVGSMRGAAALDRKSVDSTDQIKAAAELLKLERQRAKLLDDLASKVEDVKDVRADRGDRAMVLRLDEKIRSYRDMLGKLNAADVLEKPAAYSSEQVKQATDLLRLEHQRSNILTGVAQKEKEAAKAAADAAESKRRQVLSNIQLRGSSLAELAIIEAQARGQTRKAERLQRELRLQQLIAEYRQKGSSPEDATDLAQRQVDAEEALAKGRGRRIRGFKQSRESFQESQQTFRNLDEADKARKGPGLLDKSRQNTPLLDFFEKLQDRTTKAFPGPGQPNAGEAAMSRGTAAARSAAAEAATKERSSAQQAKTVATNLGQLDAVVRELQLHTRHFSRLEAA